MCVGVIKIFILLPSSLKESERSTPKERSSVLKVRKTILLFFIFTTLSNIPWILNHVTLSDGEYKEVFNLTLPKYIVPGAVYPTVTVIGRRIVEA